MNPLTGEPLIDADDLERRDRRARPRGRQPASPRTPQLTAVRGARSYFGDRLIRTAAPHRLLDPATGPLIAVRLHVLTRKTLGGLETDLGSPGAAGGRHARCPACTPPARWPASAAAGMHGYRSLEGTFLGGCLFSGRAAGRAAAADIA